MADHRDCRADDRRPVIAQIVPALETGGAERTTIDVAAALAREGFRPLVVSEGGRMVPELLAAGGEWIEMPLDTKSPLRMLVNAARLRALIRHARVALVHARSRAPAWSALLAARMTATPFVATYHGAYSARSPLKRFYNSVMLRGDAVIANSAWTAHHIEAGHQVKPKRLLVIPRGIDTCRFDPAAISPARVAAMRASWGARDRDIVILLPGRLTRWKGQLVFLDALSRLSQARGAAGLRAVLAGDAQGRASYADEIARAARDSGLQDRIVICGHVEDMEVAYRAADIVVSASTDPEAFGRVAAEASAMERPVVATDHGGARETIVPGETGLLVPPGDVEALARALDSLVTAGPQARAAMGEKGRRHVTGRFTIDRMTADTIALYRTLIAGPRPW